MFSFNIATSHTKIIRLFRDVVSIPEEDGSLQALGQFMLGWVSDNSHQMSCQPPLCMVWVGGGGWYLWRPSLNKRKGWMKTTPVAASAGPG